MKMNECKNKRKSEYEHEMRRNRKNEYKNENERDMIGRS
jgi:hypothetical protein